MDDRFEPTLQAALARIAAVRPNDYARTRNFIDGAVTGLSPYITHGFVSLPQVLTGVSARRRMAAQHKFVFELGWREYFRHVWRQRGDAILASLHAGPLPEDAYACELPLDIRQARTGVPVIDQALRSLHATGMLHNHARMWLASYVVHLRKVHWRAGADWLYGHLLDGDLASNHLSWQWVAGTGSQKAYLFNADNVARYAPPSWSSRGSVIDASYEAMDRLSRQRDAVATFPAGDGLQEPALHDAPPADSGCSRPDAALVRNRDVWLVHPWSLGVPPTDLGPDTILLGLQVAEFHRAWPWSARRWAFVGTRLAELTPLRWFGEAAAIGAALAQARSVRGIEEPHLGPWLPRWADLRPAPSLFPTLDGHCDSFAQWWTRVWRARVPLQPTSFQLEPNGQTP